MAEQPQRKQRKLFDYFSSESKTILPASDKSSSPESSKNEAHSSLATENSTSEQSCSLRLQHTEGINQPSAEIENISKNDIGNFVNNRPKDESVLLDLIVNPWKPPSTYPLPAGSRTDNRNKSGKSSLRPLNPSKFREWMVFSHIKQGLLCLPCVLFSKEANGNHAIIFVTKPCTDFGSWSTYANKHEKGNPHKTSVMCCSNFKQTKTVKEADIRNRFNEQRIAEVNANRAGLGGIVSAITVCGVTGKPLRGTNDDGDLWAKTECPGKLNDGLLREIMRAQIARGDEPLQKHLQSARKNALYTSKTTQNDIIQCCGDVRYVSDNDSDFEIKEHFLKFVELGEGELTGSALSGRILESLTQIGIDVTGLIGMGFDGASAMRGKFNGAQAKIREKFPMALYVHCAAHCLNLVITHSSSVPAIRDCWGVLHSINNLFTTSAMRTALFDRIAKEHQGKIDSTKTRLKGLCDTRWIERHDAVETFASLFPIVIDALWELKNNGVKEAAPLIKSIDLEFICALAVLRKVLAITKSVSESLQAVGTDLNEATNKVKVVVEQVKCWKSGDVAESEFHQLWEEQIIKMAEVADVSVAIPRLNRRQKHRENPEVSVPEDYYRITVYISFLDHVLSELNARFSDHFKIASGFGALLPSNIGHYEFPAVKDTVCHFLSLLPADTVDDVRHEFNFWKAKWQEESVSKRPKTITDSLSSCSPSNYPSICQMLKIFATLPVSTATGERSFSTLSYIKDYRRTTMTEERLNGLALMFIHNDNTRPRETFIDSVIDTFAAKLNRRIDFVL